jgi:hypothetical protein
LAVPHHFQLIVAGSSCQVSFLSLPTSTRNAA